jgi:DNA-binding MarR family transcriptional regulator
MKDIIDNINKVFENKTRLGIMSALMVNEKIDFKSLKKLLDVTDGNISSNISVLEKLKFISVAKIFIDKKSNTTYSITKKGRKAFEQHLNALEKLIKSMH